MERHRQALSALAGHRTELAAYDAMVGLARRLSLDPEPVPAVVPPQAPVTEAAADPGVGGRGPEPVADVTAVEQVA